MTSSFYGKPSQENPRTPKRMSRSGVLATKRRQPQISIQPKKRRRTLAEKRPVYKKHNITHRHKRKPQITVVYGKLHSVTCGHCIALEPIWKQVDDHFKHHNRKFPHSRVMYKEVAIENSHLGVGIAEANNTYLSNSPTKIESPMGFPTIFRIYDGKLEYFNGNRDYNTLVRWFSRGPPQFTT